MSTERPAKRATLDKSGTVEGNTLSGNNDTMGQKSSKAGETASPVCIFAGLEAKALAMACAAAQAVFPKAGIREVKTLDEALAKEMTPGGLLVVGDIPEADLKRAVEAKDKSGMPCWSVVALGDTHVDNSSIETVPSEDLDLRRMKRAFSSAAARYHLLRENARMRGDLLAVASRVTHDLRTPLGGILSTGEVVKECLAEAAPDHAELAMPLFDSADELGLLIERVSFVLRASARPMPKEFVDMGEVVWAALQSVESEAVRLNALLIQPEEWPKLACVPNWTEPIFVNLVANALRYGGKPPRVELSWQKQGDEFRFCVRDNGKGVSEELRPTLFQPFHSLYQLNGSRGLGLSITQRLVELQGGRCGYEPLTGGSRFCFTLPAAEGASAA